MFRGENLDPAKADTVLIKDYHIMNEVVIDRGPSPGACTLDIFINEIPLTTCVGDGIILATPTGSTAYNMAAGGSIIQTNTDCIALSPLAQHGLAFRPLILPSTTQIKVMKHANNRG